MIKTKKYNKYIINIYTIVIGTDLKTNKQYLLSTNDKEIEFPKFILDSNEPNLEKHIIDTLKEYVAANELELMPQLICVNPAELINNKKKNETNIIYSSLINKNSSINNAYWIEFDFLNPNKYINLIFEIIQKLK